MATGFRGRTSATKELQQRIYTMAIDTSGRKKVDYFTGIEVETSPMKGQPTLFVVGVKPVSEIVEKAGDIRHIYLGTSQSFNPANYEDWMAWEKMILELLKLNYWVTLDVDVKYCAEIHETGLNEFNNFISMISVKIPYIKLYNYNTVIKIDDQTWGHSNSGVWCHYLSDLKDRKVYTDWKDYVGDEPV